MNTRKHYLLVIAIDTYGDEFPRLSNPIYDVNRVVKLLVNEYKFANVGSTDLRESNLAYDRYEEEIPVYSDTQNYLTNCLYNKDATTKAIITTLTQIYNRIGPEDALLIYFAGHGIKGGNNNFYLLCFNSKKDDQTSWLNITEIYTQFDHFNKSNKCRDLMLVLDACYSGASAFGRAESAEGNFSRFLLTSTTDKEVAYDGIAGRGSGFANAFLRYLQGNTNPYLEFNEGSMKSWFEGSEKKGDETQIIRYVQIPGEYGQSPFIFERAEKDKPKIEDIKESFIEHLDFDGYRTTMKTYYKKSLSSLNIIITQGYSFNVQKVGWKVLFRWLSKPGRDICFDRPELPMMLTPIKIKKAEDNIWDVLFNEIKPEENNIHKENTAIHDWYFQKLMTGDERYAGKRHVMLWIYFTVGGNETFSRIENFCEEFSSLFLQKIKGLPEEERKDAGKMFIFFSDEREKSEAYSINSFTRVSNKDKFNLITTPLVDPISSNHIDEWVEAITQANKTSLIQALKDPKVVKAMVEKAEYEDYDCNYEDFIRYVCAHCKFSESEKTELNNYLFEFTKSFI